MKKIVIMSDNHGDMNILTDIKVLEDDAHPDNTSAAVASVIKVFFIIIPLSI